MKKHTFLTRRILGLSILPAIAFVSVATEPAPANARERQYQANLSHYCKKNFRTKSWRWDSKTKIFHCFRRVQGFNYWSDRNVGKINPARLCRQQFRTPLWFSRYKKVFCIVRTTASKHGDPTGRVRPTGRANTILSLCNDMNFPIYTAFAQFDNGRRNGWVSKGWFIAPPRGCKSISLGRHYHGSIYVYAQARGSSWSGRSAALCINNRSGFQLSHSGRRPCSHHGLRKVSMSKMRVQPGNNVWRFR